MASVQLDTTSNAVTISHGRNIERAGARSYALTTDDNTLSYRYSDDDGATWSSNVSVTSIEAYGSLCYDSVNGRLNICYAGGNNAAQALRFRAITTNVTSGVPGALTTETVIDAGGGNLGVQYPFMLHSATGTNPRYWIIALKYTAASVIETRAWFVTAGTSADTAGNWSAIGFTNLGGNSGSIGQKAGIGFWWPVSGAEKVTLIWLNAQGGAQPFEGVTFDPTAATPTPGTVTTVTGSSCDTFDWAGNGAPIALAAKADYLVFGRLDAFDSTWDFFKTVNGTNWSTPTGWSGLTMGRCQISLSGSDFYLVHTDSYGGISTTAQALKYRKITTASDGMGATSAFSDTNGNGVSVPRDTGTTKLFCLYRGSTASPYTVRSDNVAVAAAVNTGRPSADSVDGAWTDQAGGTSLFAVLDETSSSDADYIRSELGPTASGTRVKLDTITDPASSTGHIIRWRVAKDTPGGDQIDMTVTLRQGGGAALGGGTLIAAFTRPNVLDTWTTCEETLSAAQADSITDYADLYLEFTAALPSGSFGLDTYGDGIYGTGIFGS